ncbi:MAG: hypothetical protein ABI222_09335 [Opitutaceae bacterium]
MKSAVSLLFLLLLCVSARAEVANVGALAVDIPADFKIQTKQRKDASGDTETNRWQAEDGRSIEILISAHSAKQDRGALVVANKEPVEVAGQRTKLIATKEFRGEQKKVFVVFLNFDDSIYLIAAEKMTLNEFRRFLQGINLTSEN